jgi:hypothetical protein
MLTDLKKRIDSTAASFRNRRVMARLNKAVAARSAGSRKPRVAFFNASARIHGLSLNAAFALLASWGLRLADLDVVHFVCDAGMSRCVLGTDRDDFSKAPPCASCIAQSKRVYAGAQTHWFNYREDEALHARLAGLTLAQLQNFVYHGQSLGEQVLPGLRWALRRHNLPDTKELRDLFREYILSAHNVTRQFRRFLEELKPDVVILFNGQMFPEAVARYVAEEQGVRVITHEVSFQPFSAFFTEGQATAYPIDIPADFDLDDAQNHRLDDYLSARFQGDFSMAGIQFWPEMAELDAAFIAKAARFKQLVPVFTNVIFDTSQPHANAVFSDMFTWLDLIARLIEVYPDTLFVIRAHPDEMRPGTQKQSRESVHDWVEQNGLHLRDNVVFIDSHEYLSSYALIRRAKFVMVYNSSIGLEATLMNVPVLCGGKARYTAYETVFFPRSARDFREQAQSFLAADAIPVPAEFIRQARRFLYYQLFKTGLPFADFLEEGPVKGYVRLKHIPLDALHPDRSTAARVLLDGLTTGADFLV